MAARPRRVNLTISMNRSASHMLRNLALPVFIFFIMSLTGCQSLLLRERPAQDDSVVSSIPVPEQPRQPVVAPQRPQVSPTPPAPKTHTITIHEQTIQTPTHVDGRLVLGTREMATLPNLNLKMEAKLDTGAETAQSMHAIFSFLSAMAKSGLNSTCHVLPPAPYPRKCRLKEPPGSNVRVCRP